MAMDTADAPQMIEHIRQVNSGGEKVIFISNNILFFV